VYENLIGYGVHRSSRARHEGDSTICQQVQKPQIQGRNALVGGKKRPIHIGKHYGGLEAFAHADS
jgi:hypothetical protein